MADKRPAKEREEEPLAEEPASGLADLLETAEAPPAETQERRARLAEDRLAEVLAAYRELKTGNETFRERTTRNIERRFEGRHERLLLKFIDIMDNLDRALEASQTSFASTPLVEGLILVRTQLLQMLKDEGLERIPVLGLPFDPHVSEAVEMQPVEDAEHHNVVVKELQRGWRLKDRIARASRVVLGEFSGAAPAEGLAARAVAATAPEAAAAIVSEAEPEFAEAVAAEPAASELMTALTAEPSLEDIIAQAEAEDGAAPKPPSLAESLLDGLLDDPTLEELPTLEEIPPEPEDEG